MLTEISVKICMEMPSYEKQRNKGIVDLLCEATETLTAQLSLMSHHKVEANLFFMNSDIGQLEFEFSTGMAKQVEA